MTTLPTPKGYYVYELVDPFDDEVFYVGKGKGRRMYAHEREARTLASGNQEKHERIATIHRLGGKVRHRIVKDGLTEPEAFALERKRIASHGIHNLTNAVPGQTDPGFKNRLKARKLLAKMRPQGPWLTDRGRHAHLIYAEVRMLLRELADTGRADRFDAIQANRARRKGGRHATNRHRLAAHPETGGRPQRRS